MNPRVDTEPLLDSHRVLDLTDEKGWFCGKILGDLGADVIKVEKPGGQPARNTGPFYHDVPHPERSLPWMYCNSSKRGITLDIEAAAGRDVFKSLVRSADFLIESFSPGYMEKLGLGYEAVSAINPAIVFTSVTPFGQSGPYRDYKASDIVLWAMGGIMATCGDKDRAPVRCSVPQAYYFAGLQAATGSMVAHYHRQLTGEGQYVDVSIQESVLLNVPNSVTTWDTFQRNTMRSEGMRVRMLYPCKDGRVVCSIGGAGVGWTQSTIALTNWMAEEGMAGELAEMDWHSFNPGAATPEQIQRAEEILGAFFLTRTKQELYEAAVERGFSLAPSSTPKDLMEDVQLAARDFYIEVEHPELGDTVTYAGAPLQMSHHHWGIRRRAPLIGEHNEEVYQAELGLSPEEVAALKRDGVI